RVLRLPPAPPSNRPRVHEHAPVPRLRPAGLPLPRDPVLDHLLRAESHLAAGRRLELRRSAERGAARSAVAGAVALLRSRQSHRARYAQDPVERGAPRLVETDV